MQIQRNYSKNMLESPWRTLKYKARLWILHLPYYTITKRPTSFCLNTSWKSELPLQDGTLPVIKHGTHKLVWLDALAFPFPRFRVSWGGGRPQSMNIAIYDI